MKLALIIATAASLATPALAEEVGVGVGVGPVGAGCRAVFRKTDLPQGAAAMKGAPQLIGWIGV